MEYILAFIVGGLICVVGQIILDTTKLTPAHILVTFLLIGVVLGAIGIYKPLVEFAGAGATIPISGFGYSLSKDRGIYWWNRGYWCWYSRYYIVWLYNGSSIKSKIERIIDKFVILYKLKIKKRLRKIPSL